jgi:DNA helicase-2/ATP-dependent DNA helicase PcrA
MPKENSSFCQNEGQKLAICHETGPMLVLAGPGSGKTYVITHRIKHLISECHIPPEKILVITFTKSAALEMQSRANALLKQCAYVQFGTFHSIFYQILRKSNPEEQLTLISDKERICFVKAILSECTNHVKDIDNMANACLKEISLQKNMMPDFAGTVIARNEEISDAVGGLERYKFEEVYREYQAWLAENHKLDFDDMLLQCYHYLYQHQNERVKWQNRFAYILIDEFQDINTLQYETIKLLSANHNLFVVGDDDQAIYGFRGADPSVMKRFEQDFGAKKIQLSYNYRCSGNITNMAAGFIGHNKQRFDKTILAANPPGAEIVRIKLQNRDAEKAFLAQEISSFQKENPSSTQAVLTRTNGLLSGYQNLYKEKGENPLWEDMLAYLSFINEGRKRSDFLKIMNKPMRYISRNIVTEPIVCFELLKKRLGDKPWIQKRIDELEKQVKFAEKLDFGGQLHYFWKTMGYEQYRKESTGESREKMKAYAEDFAHLLEAVRKIQSLEDLRQMLEEDNVQNTETISFMTYHGSKGLEFDRVYLPDLNYGKVPHGRMLTATEIEEERRMFYVALTRAKESLFLISTTEQDSPFLAELI